MLTDIAPGSFRRCFLMSDYCRMHMPGGPYFFTVNLLERRRRLLVEPVDLLRISFAEAKKYRPFEIIAIVILPDHLHCIWRLPEGDNHNTKGWKPIE